MDSVELRSDCEVFCTNVMEAIDYFDKHGFAVFKKESPFSQDNKTNDTSRNDLSPVQEVYEWQKIFSRWTKYTKRGLGIKLFNSVRRGVPNSLRGDLWRKLLEIDVLRNATEFDYEKHQTRLRTQLQNLCISEFNTLRAEQVLSRVLNQNSRDCDLNDSEIQNIRQIFLDIDRTFPTHISFLGNSPEAIEGRASLFRILAMYTQFNPTVGYCQGMSFIAGMLTMILPEVEAFWCLVVLLEKPKYLYGYFDTKLEKIQRHALVFDHLLKQREPELWNHLHVFGVHPLMYIIPWFMCMFTSLPCWDTVLAIWDLVLLKGVVVIFETAIALMQVLKSNLLAESDVNALILLLQKPPVHCLKRSVMIPAIYKIGIQRWEIDNILTAVMNSEKKVESVEHHHFEDSKGLSHKWTQIRKKFHRSKVDSKENSLVKAFTKMFNGTATKTSTNDDQDFAFQLNSLRSPFRELNLSGSMVAHVSRIRRLKTVNGQFESPESRQGVAHNLIGSPLEHEWAFKEFSHLGPSREFGERDPMAGQDCPISPEMELKLVGHFNCSFTSLDSSFNKCSCKSPSSTQQTNRTSRVTRGVSKKVLF